ncbi:MAG: polysaccharide deacetylase family protein [Kiritimatiellae bacterium]|nr:polysaccharide deacetylase family protein [Kiritimatiellia bacterium]
MIPGAASKALPGYDFYAGLARRLAAVRRPRGRIPVLLYHSVSPAADVRNAGLFNVTPATLDTQLHWLKDNGFHFITPEEWLAWRAAPPDTPLRRAIVAFDDGYRNNLEHALPILQRHGVRAVFFIASSFLGAREPFPWIDGPDRDAFRPMDAGGLRELDAAGMVVGAHTRTHRRLNTLTDAEALSEIRESKKELERLLGKPVTTFAYPYGSKRDQSPRHAELCREAGFTTAFTTRPVSSTRRTDPFAIPRMTVYERDGTELFGLKARGLFDGYDLFRRLIRTVCRR